MGSSSSKFKKYLQHGDEYAAMQVYQSSSELRKHLQPSYSYGEHHEHNTPLHYAARHGMKHLIRAFLTDLEGGDPNRSNALGQTALHCACDVQRRPHKSPSALERRSYSVMLLLSWHGPDRSRVNVNAQDRFGFTAAHYAARSGLRKCMEYLLAHGADVFLENREGLSPCDLAVREGHHHVAQLLESRIVFSGTPESMASGESTDLQQSRIRPGGAVGASVTVAPAATIGVRHSSQDNEDDDEEEEEEEEEVYCGLRAQDLQEAKEQLLIEIGDMLHVPLFSAEALLRNAEWSRENLMDQWSRDPVGTCQDAGVPVPQQLMADGTTAVSKADEKKMKPTVFQRHYEHVTPKIHSENSFVVDEELAEEGLLCELCCDLMNASASPTDEELACGHRFCHRCWKNYLDNKIAEGKAVSVTAGTYELICPAFECNNSVPLSAVEKHVSPGMIRKLLKFDIKAFVESNKTIRWCPYPGCQRAVSFPEYCHSEKQLLKQGTGGVLQASHSVDCGAGHFFCWECGGEAHAPVSCSLWSMWLSRCNRTDPSELQVVALNYIWLVTHTRECPNCRCNVQKTEGCNRTRCPKCRYDFCWVCKDSWRKHSRSSNRGGSSGGGGGLNHHCNRYSKEVEKQEQGARHKDMVRFAHFYSRYKNHGFSRRMEEPLMHSARSKRELLQSSLGGGVPRYDTKFYEDGVWELLKARTILCSSYAYGFFLVEDNSNNSTVSKQRRALFETLQNDMESATERLSEIIARPYLHTPRRDIIQTILSCRRKRQDFLKACYRGLGASDMVKSKSQDSQAHQRHHISQAEQQQHYHRHHQQKQHLTLDNTKASRGNPSATATLMRSQVNFMVGVDIDRKRLVESISDHLYHHGGPWREGAPQSLPPVASRPPPSMSTMASTAAERAARQLVSSDSQSQCAACRRQSCLPSGHREHLCQHRIEQINAMGARFPFRSLRREVPKIKGSRSSSTPTVVNDDDEVGNEDHSIKIVMPQQQQATRGDQVKAKRLDRKHAVSDAGRSQNLIVKVDASRSSALLSSKDSEEENEEEEGRGKEGRGREDGGGSLHDTKCGPYHNRQLFHGAPSGGGRLSRSSRSDDNILSSSLAEEQRQYDFQSHGEANLSRGENLDSKLPSAAEAKATFSGSSECFAVQGTLMSRDELGANVDAHAGNDGNSNVSKCLKFGAVLSDEDGTADDTTDNDCTSVRQLDESPGACRRPMSRSRRKGSATSAGSTGSGVGAGSGIGVSVGIVKRTGEVEDGKFTVGDIHQYRAKEDIGARKKSDDLQRSQSVGAMDEAKQDKHKGQSDIITLDHNCAGRDRADNMCKPHPVGISPRDMTQMEKPVEKPKKRVTITTLPKAKTEEEILNSGTKRAGRPRFVRQKSFELDSDSTDTSLVEQIASAQRRTSHEDKCKEKEDGKEAEIGKSSNHTSNRARKPVVKVDALLSPREGITTTSSKASDDGLSEAELAKDAIAERRRKKRPELTIKIDNSSFLDDAEAPSDDPELESVLARSPTLHISGVCISKTSSDKKNTSRSAGPSPKSPSAVSSSTLAPFSPGGSRQYRSSSLVVPPSAPASSSASHSYCYSPPHSAGPGAKSLRPISLSGTSSPLQTKSGMAAVSSSSTAALRFTFPDSASSLSTVLHVRDSHLSNDDFHEALFFGRSPKSNKKRKKSKKVA